ncbi:MAG: hypothetical protein R3C11_02110 [Planctomycetaceae bacterium]
MSESTAVIQFGQQNFLIELIITVGISQSIEGILFVAALTYKLSLA